MTPTQVACTVLGVCAAAALVATLAVQTVATHQRTSMGAQQGAAVATLLHVQAKNAVSRAQADTDHVHARARAAAADLQHVLPSARIRAETHMPFPCVTVITDSDSQTAVAAATAALAAARYVPKQGIQQFTREGVTVKLRTPSSAPPPLPTPPTQALTALRALDHLFGGRHYVQTKATSEGGLDTADPPAALKGGLC